MVTNVVMLSVFMLNVTKLSFIMNIVILYILLPSVNAVCLYGGDNMQSECYAECHFVCAILLCHYSVCCVLCVVLRDVFIMCQSANPLC